VRARRLRAEDRDGHVPLLRVLPHRPEEGARGSRDDRRSGDRDADYACTSALALVKSVQRDAPAPDRWIDAAAPKLEANLAIIARTRAASAALATALATQTDLPALEATLQVLRDSAKSPPSGN